jgi:hypothetical protein
MSCLFGLHVRYLSIIILISIIVSTGYCKGRQSNNRIAPNRFDSRSINLGGINRLPSVLDIYSVGCI